MTLHQTSQELQHFKEEICPLTSVKIKKHATFKDIQLTDEYWVTFELINDNILSAFPRGNISYKGTLALFENYDRFLEAVNLSGKKYIEISDYSGINNLPSKRARFKVLDLLMEKIDANLLIGHFVYNVPRHIRWMYNIGTRLKAPKIPMFAFDTYQEAIEASFQVLLKQKNIGYKPSLFKKIIQMFNPSSQL